MGISRLLWEMLAVSLALAYWLAAWAYEEDEKRRFWLIASKRTIGGIYAALGILDIMANWSSIVGAVQSVMSLMWGGHG